MDPAPHIAFGPFRLELKTPRRACGAASRPAYCGPGLWRSYGICSSIPGAW